MRLFGRRGLDRRRRAVAQQIGGEAQLLITAQRAAGRELNPSERLELLTLVRHFRDRRR